MGKKSKFHQIRKAVNAHWSCPVVILDNSNQKPIIEGTPSKSYFKRHGHTWEYIASTQRIEVGSGWIAKRFPNILVEIAKERLDPQKGK